MSVVKIIELVSTSPKSWEDAVRQALEDASKTVRNIVGIDVVGFKVIVENGRITGFRTNVKVAFLVEEKR